MRWLVLLFALPAACSGPSATDTAADERAEQVARVAEEADLGADVQEFLAAASRGVAGRYTVTYALPDETGGTATLVQDPPRRRVDVRTIEGGEEVTRSVIVNGDGTFSCDRRAGRWLCGRSTAELDAIAPFGADDLDRLLERLEKGAQTYEFRTASREVAGTDARCLVTELRAGQPTEPGLGQRGTLCVSDEGAPLLVETPTTSLRAQRYSTDVDGAAFDLPATPEGE